MKGATMTWQDFLTVFTAFVSIVELFYLVKIFVDDHAIRSFEEESLKLNRESVELQKKSLEAQNEYLAMRRKWYASRVKAKEKDNDKADLRPVDGDNKNSL